MGSSSNFSLTNGWTSLRNSSLFCNTKSFNWGALQSHAECSTTWTARTRQTLSTSCIWILVVVTSSNIAARYLFVKVECEMLTVHRQMDSAEKQSLFWQRWSHSIETFCCSKCSFSQFWTVFPSFGREKLGKTGLSQFIPFWTAKTGFGREKPNPDTKCYQYIHLPFDSKLSTRHV